MSKCHIVGNHMLNFFHVFCVCVSLSLQGCDRRKAGETAIPGRTKFHHLPLSYIEDLHVLQKLVKLADPGTKVGFLAYPGSEFVVANTCQTEKVGAK